MRSERNQPGIRALFGRAWSAWRKDDGPRLAAALAYYTALSLAPMVVLGVLLLKFLGIDGQQVIGNQMGMLMGEAGREMAREMIGSAKMSDGWLAAIVSAGVLIWGASNVFAQLQSSMNAIWEVQLRPGLGWRETIRRRFLSVAMVFGIGFLLLTSLFVSTILAALVDRLAGDAAAASALLDAVLTFGAATVFFAGIFAVLPDLKIAWRDVVPGAAITSLLFTLGKNLLAFYLAYGSTASAFGAAGSLAAVLIWVYYSAQIMFFGAEFTRAWAQARGARIRYAADAVPAQPPVS
jgi:membrane protein